MSGKPSDPGPPKEAVGAIHTIGNAEVTQTQQGDITIFAVRGEHNGQLPRALERILTRTMSDVGLDLREYKGPARSIVPLLRKMNRHFATCGRVFLLYEPPTKVVDQLKLAGTIAEYSIFTSGGGLAPSQVLPSSADNFDEETPAQTTREIVLFTKNLERAEQLETSMDTAGRRSHKMLDFEPPDFHPFQVATEYFPHDKVGGDFFALPSLGDDHLGITIGDVAGHGLEAALIMGMTKKVFDIRATEGPKDDPGAVVTKVNEDIYPDLDRYTFVTGFYGVLERATGEFRYARAGHNYPILISPSRGEMIQLNRPGIALGMDGGTMFKATLKSGQETMRPGDFLLVYTDGLVEAAHPRRGQFGIDRVLQFFRENDLSQSAGEVKDQLMKTLNRFIDDAQLQDDLTVILVKHGG